MATSAVAVTEWSMRAGERLSTVIGNIDESKWHAATPCEEMDVEALVSHVSGALANLGGALATAVRAEPLSAMNPELPPAQRWAQGWTWFKGLLSRSDILDVQVTFRKGEMPGAQLIEMGVGEMTIHAWDLARATGQATDVDPELAEHCLASMQSRIKPEYRGPGKAFGVELPAPAGATAADKLAAFSGRTLS